jgi:hypothetical protein
MARSASGAALGMAQTQAVMASAQAVAASVRTGWVTGTVGAHRRVYHQDTCSLVVPDPPQPNTCVCRHSNTSRWRRTYIATLTRTHYNEYG